MLLWIPRFRLGRRIDEDHLDELKRELIVDATLVSTASEKATVMNETVSIDLSLRSERSFNIKWFLARLKSCGFKKRMISNNAMQSINKIAERFIQTRHHFEA